MHGVPGLKKRSTEAHAPSPLTSQTCLVLGCIEKRTASPFFRSLAEKELLRPKRKAVPRCSVGTSMAHKRAAEDIDTAAHSKKFRNVIDEMADEFVCPITQELSVDPVTAEDGRVYERSAMEEWLARQPDAQVKTKPSPTAHYEQGDPCARFPDSIRRVDTSREVAGVKHSVRYSCIVGWVTGGRG